MREVRRLAKKKKIKDETPDLWNKRKCATCGKEFYSTPQWSYRIKSYNRDSWFCKYSCKTAYEQKKQTRRYSSIRN